MDVQPNFTLINIFIIGATVQGFIFSIFLLASKKFKTEANKYLGYTVLLISIYNLYFWFIDTKLWLVYDWKAYRATFFISWELLMLPMYYYFVATYLGKKELVKKYYTYPFFVTLFVHILIAVGYNSIENFYSEYCFLVCPYDKIISFLSPLFSVLMVFLVFKLIYDYEKQQTQFDYKTVSTNTKWLKNLLYTTLILCLLTISVRIYNEIYKANIRQDFIWAIMSILLYWLCYAGVYHVGIFNQRRKIRNKQPKEQKNNSLIQKDKNDRFADIDNCIKQEQLYLNPTLSLHTLANHFNISEGHLSRLFNSSTNKSFTDYINNLRIEKSKSLLKNKEFKNYTIIAIALESGFNSKSSFYKSFKKNTGISPTEYRKTL